MKEPQESPQVVVFPVESAGITLFEPVGEDAAKWIAQNCPPAAWDHFSGSLGVSTRYAGRLISAMRAAGLKVVIGK